MNHSAREWYGSALTRCPSIIVQQVWTAGGDGTAKTTFYPGEEIIYKLLVHNTTKSRITADILWMVLGPQTNAEPLHEERRVKLYPGQSNHYMESSLPSDTVASTYILWVSAQWNELISTQQQVFTVSEPDIP